MEKLSRERFIRLGTALGVGAACASLVACGGGAASSGGGSGGGKSGGGNSGGDSSGGGSQASSSSSDNAGGGSSGGKSDGGSDGGNAGGGKQKASGGDSKAGEAAIASESEVAPGSAVAFKESGNPAVLVHLDSGDFVAYSAVCTHQGCKVA